MDNRREVQAFLTLRRAAVQPAQVGLVGGARRRVPGLRRGEVADLAGLSVEYYTRLERGDLKGASEGVLDALASALRLSTDERSHLHDLARAARQRAIDSEGTSRVRHTALRPGLRQTLDGLAAPAVVVDFRMDVLAVNAPGRSLYADLYADAANDDNYARFVFLDPAARAMYRDWGSVADEVVATLRTAAGRHPADRRLGEVVGQLTLHDASFSRRWAAHNVRQRSFGTKRIHHRGVGDLELSYETFQVPTEPDLALMVYTAATSSSSADALELLAVWAADQDSTTVARGMAVDTGSGAS